MGETIQVGWGFLMKIIGYEAVILSNHRSQFDLTTSPGIISNVHVSVGLWHLKNVKIQLANNILEIYAYIFNPKNFCQANRVFFKK